MIDDGRSEIRRYKTDLSIAIDGSSTDPSNKITVDPCFKTDDHDGCGIYIYRVNRLRVHGFYF